MLYTGIMFFFGIISGWTNENMAVALVFMLIGFLVYYKKQIGKIPTWAIAGLIGATIGAIFMIAAPGNYVRMENVVSNNYTGQPTIYVLFSRILGAVAAYYYYVLIPTFIFFILLWLYLAFGNKQSKKNAVLFLAFLFFSGAIVATSAMSASPIFPGRAAFGIISLILVACGILYSNLDFSNKLLNRLSFTSVIFALLLFTADYYRGYKALDMVQRHMQNRVEIIESGKKNGQTDFVFEDRMTPPDSRFTHFFELTPDSTDWHNGIYSAYYGIHSIIVK